MKEPFGDGRECCEASIEISKGRLRKCLRHGKYTFEAAREIHINLQGLRSCHHLFTGHLLQLVNLLRNSTVMAAVLRDGCKQSLPAIARGPILGHTTSVPFAATNDAPAPVEQAVDLIFVFAYEVVVQSRKLGQSFVGPVTMGSQEPMIPAPSVDGHGSSENLLVQNSTTWRPATS
jgi:hypothetical protein